MTTATTTSYNEMVLEVEFDPVGAAGTYSKICGMTGVTINRTPNITETPVPDCDDESLPHNIEKDVASISVTVSATGVWAAARKHELLDWFYSAGKLNCRLRDVQAEQNGASGDIYAEYGPAVIGISNERPADKGRITASIELQFDGTPQRLTVA
ncbi:MAG: hypothetical protein CMH12_03350 [Maritimibacter sp.]|nr:hypothetical protein [Maritimibacter sp.]